MKDFITSNAKVSYLNKETTIIILLSLAQISLVFSFPLLDKYFWILLIDRFTSLIVSFFVFVVAFPLELIYDKRIEMAKNKIKNNKNLLTIGIVGSYGKSSTKEFIYQLLVKKYKVVKTKGHQNSIAEIADTILKYIKKSTQIFIVEMNDFSKGDIRKITDVVLPGIGIITGVNPQNLSLFKTLADSTLSKKELIDSMQKKSLILFNGNDKEVAKLYKKDKKTKKIYLLNKSKILSPIDEDIIYAENKKISKNSISFDVVFGSKKLSITSPLIGGQNIENLLPAIYLANYLGLKESEIKKASLSLTPPEYTMIKKENALGVIFLDDTSTPNPESVFAALEYMKLYRKRKIVVMQTMIELGKEGNNLHKKIAQLVAEQCDAIFVTNKDYYKIIKKTIQKSGYPCRVFHISTNRTINYINENTSKGDIVLFEGFDARFVLNQLK